MTNELEPCPFCGGEATVMESPDGFASVGCANDWCPTTHMVFPLMFSFNSKEKAINAWNTRHKRTCEWSIKKGGTFYDVYQCSACGYEYAESRTDHGIKVELIDAKFCPNCGAEVVDGD